MEFRMKMGQREIVRIAMALLTKQGEKAQKLLTVLQLPTEHVDTLVSRAGLASEATGGHVEQPVNLNLPLRAAVRQGLVMYLGEVEGTQEDELSLGIDPEGSTQKVDEIKAVFAMITEQTSFTDFIRDNSDEIEKELNYSLPDGMTATVRLGDVKTKRNALANG